MNSCKSIKILIINLIVMFILIFLLCPACKTNTFYSDKTMVCLGDSITSGYLVNTAYPEKVKQILGLKNAYNHGIPGSTLSHAGGVCPFVDRYDEMESADIVSVLFAGNDASHHVPIGDVDDNTSNTICGSLNILINGLKNKYPSAYIFFITPLLNVDYFAAISPYVKATRVMCQKHNIDLLDQYNQNVEYNSGRDTVDGVHLNQNYINNVLSPRIADFIKNHFENEAILT